jgi:hypothetical protein
LRREHLRLRPEVKCQYAEDERIASHSCHSSPA